MKRTAIVAAVAVAAAAAGFWVLGRADASSGPALRFATVERGSIESTVSATGTLSAVRTVEVGTQVSGQVSAMLVDFNDRVHKGQLIARIDPTLSEQAVADAEAGLERVQAQLAQTQADYERNKELRQAQAVTAAELGTAESNYLQARANVKSAQVALQRARQNLAYTSIYAPIDGVVVERDVDVGQTVAASLQAPKLFVIANALDHLRILASVDESDIGQIRQGQKARFTVQAHSARTFSGTVEQVRLQSTTQDNVVSYTVVIDAHNPEGVLLPGMTATVKFVTGSATDALLVPNAALRLKPTQELLAATGGEAAPEGRTVPAGQPTAGPSGAAQQAGTLWTLSAGGKLQAMRVASGLTDGQRTQVSGAGVTAGLRVVLGLAAGNTDTGSGSISNTTTSPLQQQRSGPPGPPPGGF